MKKIKEQLYEKFAEKSDPIKDMGIGIPEHVYAVVAGDWDATETANQIANSLKMLGIYMTEDPTVDLDESGVHAFIFSKKKLSKAEIERIVEQKDEYGLDD